MVIDISWSFDLSIAFWILVNPLPEKYAQQTDEMYQELQCPQLALVNRKGPILLHNNTQLHAAQPMLQKLTELGYEVFPYLPYSPDLLPNDYHFFKHLN